MSDDYQTSDEILELRATGETSIEYNRMHKPSVSLDVDLVLRPRCDCGYRLDTNGYCKMCKTHPARTGRPEKMSLSDQIYESRDFGSMADSAARD